LCCVWRMEICSSAVRARTSLRCYHGVSDVLLGLGMGRTYLVPLLLCLEAGAVCCACEDDGGKAGCDDACAELAAAPGDWGAHGVVVF
jgi:hypothetical protein